MKESKQKNQQVKEIARGWEKWRDCLLWKDFLEEGQVVT